MLLYEMHLKLEGARLGLFGIVSEGRNRYSEFHAHLVSLLHEPFAVAISNILKHQEIQRLNQILSDDNRYLQREMIHLSGDTIIGGVRLTLRLQFGKMLLNKISPEFFPSIA